MIKHNENTILAALPRRVERSLKLHMSMVDLAAGSVLHEANASITGIYFPVTALISIDVCVDDHLPVEAGLVGREGFIGVCRAMGLSSSAFQATVQVGGQAWLMKATNFTREMQTNRPLQAGVYAYTKQLMRQMGQTSACARFHMIEARLSRWLLMARDRLRSEEFQVTHEAIAGILGVRREGVTQAAANLKRAGVIDYHRGRLRIVEHADLEKASCSCYALDPLAGWRA